MKITYVVKKGNLSDSERMRVEKKLVRLDRFFAPETEVAIKVATEKSETRLEMTVFGNGMIYRAEIKDAADVLSAADDAVDVIEGQLRKYKTKLEKRLRAGAYEPIAEEREEPKLKITNTKSFLYDSMSPEEAVLQMNLLGHQFYIFKNEEAAERVCVVYRRKDGTYGMIEPIA